MFKYFEWICSSLIDIHWRTWNYQIDENVFINIPLSIVMSIHLMIVIFLIWYLIDWIWIRSMYKKWYRLGYTDGVISKAVNLGKIKFGDAPSGIVIYEVGREEYTNEIETNFKNRKKLGDD